MFLRAVTDAGLYSTTYYADGHCYTMSINIAAGVMYTIDMNTMAVTDWATTNDTNQMQLIS